MATGKVIDGKPYAGNPHVRFDEGEVAPCTAEASLRRVHCRRQPEGRASVCAATPRRGSLLYKRIHSRALAAAAALVCGAANAAWTYDPDSGTLTDGVWTLNATLVKNTTDQLDVSGQKGSFTGTDPCPIDLTEIYDSSHNRYYAVSFACFNSYSGAWNGTKGSMLNPYKDMLTQFIAPDCHKISESGCFMNCTALTTVRLNETVTSFANHRPFQDCTSLVTFYPRTLNIPSIPTQCFAGCSALAGEFNFPDCTGNNGGGSWFNGCSKIESVKLPQITMIPGSSFSGCSSLTNVVFSESLDTIQSSAFSGCASLSGDCIRAMLSPGLTKLGNNNTDVKYIFSGCTSFDGELVWNFPLLGTGVDNKGNPTSTNVVGQSLFEGCTNLTKVTFKTDVFEIRGSAFKNLAPAAEMHMQATVPVVEAQALGNSRGPYPLVYLKDNLEEWITALEPNYHVMLKADFNNGEWSENAGTSERTRANMVTRMMEDTLMCSQDAATGNVSVRQKNVLAFCMRRYEGSNITKDYVCFWLLKESTPGLSIIVR